MFGVQGIIMLKLSCFYNLQLNICHIVVVLLNKELKLPSLILIQTTIVTSRETNNQCHIITIIKTKNIKDFRYMPTT